MSGSELDGLLRGHEGQREGHPHGNWSAVVSGRFEPRFRTDPYRDRVEDQIFRAGVDEDSAHLPCNVKTDTQGPASGFGVTRTSGSCPDAVEATPRIRIRIMAMMIAPTQWIRFFGSNTRNLPSAGAPRRDRDAMPLARGAPQSSAPRTAAEPHSAVGWAGSPEHVSTAAAKSVAEYRCSAGPWRLPGARLRNGVRTSAQGRCHGSAAYTLTT